MHKTVYSSTVYSEYEVLQHETCLHRYLYHTVQVPGTSTCTPPRTTSIKMTLSTRSVLWHYCRTYDTRSCVRGNWYLVYWIRRVLHTAYQVLGVLYLVVLEHATASVYPPKPLALIMSSSASFKVIIFVRVQDAFLYILY